MGWGVIVCGSTALYALYRITSFVAGTGDLPLRTRIPPEIVAIPLLMVLADGLVLAWILSELREAGPGAAGDAPFDPAGGGADARGGPGLRRGLAGPLRGHGRPLRPGVPAPLGHRRAARRLRALATGRGPDRPASGLADDPRPGRRRRLERRDPRRRLGYLRLLRAEAGHLVAALALASLAAGIVAAVAYAIVLALPPQTWVLAAADSYAHYATLPIGLLTLAALVELGGRAASRAGRAGRARNPSHRI